MPKEVIRSQNLDASESAFFARQLEYIKAKSYDIVYPEFKALSLIPISTEAGPGAETITYQQYDSVGLAKIINSYADDMPRSDIKGAEFSARVRSIGGSYGYSIQEIRAASMAGLPLQQRKANAARQANDQLVNRIAWFGDTLHGLNGLIYHPNTTKAGVPNGDWVATATPDEIIEDVNTILSGIMDLTLGVESADTVLLPVLEYAHIASTPRSTTSDTTILEFLRRVWPGVSFESVPELKDVNPVPSTGAGTDTNIMIAYRKSSDKLTLEIPQPFEQFPAQERGLEFVVPTHSRVGGVIVYYPLSISIGEDL